MYVAGLSAGAAAALITANGYPDIFAAVGAHSGLPVGAAHDTSSAIMAMRVGAPGRAQTAQMPTIIFHGEADRVVNSANGRFIASRALDTYTGLTKTEIKGRVAGGHKYVRTRHRIGRGRAFTEHWAIHEAGHAWSGGNTAGSFTNPAGPDASRAMVRFFLRHRTSAKYRKTMAA